MTRRAHTFLVAATMLVAAVLLAVAAPPGTATASPSTPGDPLRHVVADYNSEIREDEPRDDGIRHVDVEATIAKLKELHVTTYAYLIWHKPTDWEDLREFLPAAERAGIDVWVYLVPPSECDLDGRCSFPYTTDYVRWAKEIAKLSQQYPNLTAWAIDDFASNLDKFTPEYLGRMQSTAHAINPELEFLPVVYYRYLTEDFVDTYGQHFDGMIFPYRDYPNLNTHQTDSLRPQLDRFSALAQSNGIDVILMVYAAPYSGAPFPPSGEYIHEVVSTGLEYVEQGKISGVIGYATPKQFDVTEQCLARTGLGALFLMAYWGHPTEVGDYVSASQRVSVDPEADSYRLSFWQTDNFYAPSVDGYHIKQLLVDGQVVWEQDVSLDAEDGYRKVEVDLTSHLRGKTAATLTFRIYDKKGVTNFGVTARWDDLTATGFTVDNAGFEGTGGWEFAQSDPFFEGLIYRECDPHRERHVFEAMRDLYGPYGLVYRVEDLGGDAGPPRSLETLAGRVLEQYLAGEPARASHLAWALSRSAADKGYDVLAAQAKLVAADLEGAAR